MQELFKKITFAVQYFFLWICYFFMARAIFLLYYFSKTSDLGFTEIIQTFTQGIKLDASFSSYIAALPFLILSLSFFFSAALVSKFFKAFNTLVLFIISFLLVVDLSLYGYWGMRLDSTPLMYLNTPAEMMASISFGSLIMGVALWLLIFFASAKFFNRIINRKFKTFQSSVWYEVPVLLFLTAALLLPMRGGLQIIPINQSNVYFSSNMYANHAAVNFAWNLTHSLANSNDPNVNPYQLMDPEVARTTMEQTLKPLQISNADSIPYPSLSVANPNIIVLLWESLTAKIVEPLGGEPTVTEHLNQLSNEGLLFTNFYANGDRSDKGLVAFLSGYYPQPDKSVIKMPRKSASLPMLCQHLKSMGYSSAFYYGGDMNFGNMNTYFRSGGFEELVDGEAIGNDEHTSKWGVADHVVLEKLQADLKKENLSQPFFKVLFTLSSHEPFALPGEYKFGKDSQENQFRSSHAYTDESIGAFIAEAKKQDWWNNTLVVIMADHGHPLPTGQGGFNGASKFHIPMLWLGGALKDTPKKIETVSSQVDFPLSLLAMLGQDGSDFEYAQNIFIPSPNHYAHYIFNKGFGTLNSHGKVVYDYTAKSVILTEGDTTGLTKLGKAITQEAYQDFLNR